MIESHTTNWNVRLSAFSLQGPVATEAEAIRGERGWVVRRSRVPRSRVSVR